MLALAWKNIPMADHLHQWEVQIVARVNIHHLAIHGYPTHDAIPQPIWPTLKFIN